MSQANANNIWKPLPAGIRTMSITAAREFTGGINRETGELNRIVALTYTDKQTGNRVTQNYSLDKPTFLREVIFAVTGGDERTTNHLMSTIDWETEDAEAVYGVDVSVDVVLDKYDAATGKGGYNGRDTNRIGRVEPLNA